MNNVVAVEIPDGVDGDAVRGALLQDFGIEIGTSFGPLHGRVWRIGTMGANARLDTVLTTLAALEQVLRRAGAPGARRRRRRRGLPGLVSGLMLDVHTAARRIMARCDELAAYTSMTDGIERVYLSPEHARVNRLAAALDARGRAGHVAGRGRQPVRAPGRAGPGGAVAAARVAPGHRAATPAGTTGSSACSWRSRWSARCGPRSARSASGSTSSPSGTRRAPGSAPRCSVSPRWPAAGTRRGGT